MSWLLQWNERTSMLKSDDLLSFTLCSVCVECVCGEKSSTGGIGQLFLQQLRQRWGRRQDGVCDQWDGHHRDHHHGGRQGDHSAHGGRQKREGSLQQVATLSLKWCAAALCWLVQCSPSPIALLYSAFIEPFFPFSPPNFFPHTILPPPSLFFFWYRPPPLCPLLSSPLDSRVFRPAVRRYVMLEVLCSGVWNVFPEVVWRV